MEAPKSVPWVRKRPDLKARLAHKNLSIDKTIRKRSPVVDVLCTELLLIVETMLVMDLGRLSPRKQLTTPLLKQRIITQLVDL